MPVLTQVQCCQSRLLQSYARTLTACNRCSWKYKSMTLLSRSVKPTSAEVSEDHCTGDL